MQKSRELRRIANWSGNYNIILIIYLLPIIHYINPYCMMLSLMDIIFYDWTYCCWTVDIYSSFWSHVFLLAFFLSMWALFPSFVLQIKKSEAISQLIQHPVHQSIKLELFPISVVSFTLDLPILSHSIRQVFTFPYF